MLRIDWKDQWLAVSRLVFDADDAPSYANQLLSAARRDGLAVADPTALPRPGDFWIGCHPAGGWGDADPDRIGWASLAEVPVAVAAVRGELRTAGEWVPVVQHQAEPQFVAPFVFGAA